MKIKEHLRIRPHLEKNIYCDKNPASCMHWPAMFCWFLFVCFVFNLILGEGEREVSGHSNVYIASTLPLVSAQDESPNFLVLSIGDDFSFS